MGDWFVFFGLDQTNEAENGEVKEEWRGIGQKTKKQEEGPQGMEEICRPRWSELGRMKKREKEEESQKVVKKS